MVEKLLPYLDLNSTKHLAMSNKLTRKILKKNLTWNKVLQRFLPGEERINFLVDQSFGPPFPLQGDPILAAGRQKTRVLAEILTLINGDSLTWLSLIHTICERNPIRFSGTVIIDVSCSRPTECLLWGSTSWRRSGLLWGQENKASLKLRPSRWSIWGDLF